jgi:uncharacterized protein (TIGR02285 family)
VLCAVLFALAATPAAFAAAPEPEPDKEIVWYRMDFPPIYIPEGPYKSRELQVLSDGAIQQALEAQGYHVTFRSANMDRIQHGLRNQERACTTGLLVTPELAKTIEFSMPHSLTMPGAVLILKSRLAEFQPFLDAQGRISLELALAQSALRLGVSSGRGYSGVIDEVLLKHPDSPNIFRRKGEDIGTGLLRRLASRRIDYTILFPWEASYIARMMDLPPEQFMGLPIQGMVDYVMAGGACPKNDWGKQIIAIMNAAIERVRDTPENHAIKEYWLDENSRRLYREHWKAYRAEQTRQHLQ